VVTVASEHRSQHRNRVAARERLADLLREALAPPPPPRRPTKPTRGSQRRRLKAKKERGATKALRGRVRGESS
jgi:ribosome-associated protein